MFRNLDYLLRHIKTQSQKDAITNILNKLDNNIPLTYDDVGLCGLFEHVPAGALRRIFNCNYKMEKRISEALQEVKPDDDNMVFLPAVLDAYIMISIEKDRPRNLLDLL